MSRLLSRRCFVAPLALCLCLLPTLRADAQVVLTGNQTLTVNPGDSYTSVVLRDNSQMTQLGGSINELYPRHNSIATISGGSVGLLMSDFDSTVTISGGSVTSFYILERSKVSVSGGTFTLFGLEDGADGPSVTVTGGTFSSFYSFSRSGTLSGGNFNDTISAYGTAFVTLTGFDFVVTDSTPGAVDLGSITYEGIFYTVTGRLQNNPTSVVYSLFDAATQFRESTGVTQQMTGGFILNDLSTGLTTILAASAAPEPGALALLGMGLGLAGMGRVRGRWSVVG